MPKITIDDRGIVEELPLEPTTITVEHFANDKNPSLSVDEDGLVGTGSLARLTRFEYHEHGGGTQTTTTGSVFDVVEIDGAFDSFDGGLSTWNTTTNTFYPEEPNSIWTLRFAGQLEPVGGNPIFHLDLIISGSDPEDVIGFRHHQSVEQTIRNVADHIHVQGVFVLFADQDMFVSGAQFKMHAEGDVVTLNSASLLIKEG